MCMSIYIYIFLTSSYISLLFAVFLSLGPITFVSHTTSKWWHQWTCDLQREGNDSDVGLHQGPAGGIIVISIVLRSTHCATDQLKICSYFVAPVSFTNGTSWGEWRVVGARIPCHINTYLSGAINHCLRAPLACFFTLRLPATLLLFAD